MDDVKVGLSEQPSVLNTFFGFLHKARLHYCLFALLLLFPTHKLSAQPAMLGQPEAENVRSMLSPSPGHIHSEATLRFVPIELQGGATLTVVSPGEWHQLSDRLALSLEGLHLRFNEMLGDLPPFESSLRLMEEEHFFRTTGAPRWTNALFLKGEIIIPISKSSPPSMENLLRTVRHEYTHAVMHALSGGHCPGWLDEGLAQWAEGSENPALRPALARWLQNSNPVSLSLLQGGFTRLDSQMVPAAYAQSLFAANTVVNTFGFEQIRSYLDHLRKGTDSQVAFKKSFRVSEQQFEDKLGTQLRRWARRYHTRHHHN